MKRKAFFPIWDSKPKKITSATLGLEAKITPTMLFMVTNWIEDRSIENIRPPKATPMF